MRSIREISEAHVRRSLTANFNQSLKTIRRLRKQDVTFAQITKQLNKDKLTTITGKRWTQFNVQACFYNNA